MRLPIRALFALVLLLATSSVVFAAPGARISDYTIAEEQLVVTITDEDGEREVLAEKSGMHSGSQVLIVDSGYAILYQTRGTATGGYENETHAIKRFDVNGTKKTLLNEPLKVQNLREVRAKKGRIAYVVSMADGGAGIPTLFVVESTLGKIWQKDAARFSGARNGTVVVALFPDGEDGVDAPSLGNFYLDLDRTLDHAYRDYHY